MLVRPIDIEGSVTKGAVIARVDQHCASSKTLITHYTFLIQILVDFILSIYLELYCMQCGELSQSRCGSHIRWATTCTIGSSKYKNRKLKKERERCCSESCF